MGGRPHHRVAVRGPVRAGSGAPDVRHRLPGRDLTTRPRRSRRSVRDRAVRAVRRLTRARQRLLRAERSGRATAAVRAGAGRQGRRRCRAGHRRRGLPEGARVRHATDRWTRDRDGPGGDAARRRRQHPRGDPLPDLAAGTRSLTVRGEGDPMSRWAWGAGIATIAADGTTLDTWYRWLGWG